MSPIAHIMEEDIPINNHHNSDLPTVHIVSYGYRHGPLSRPPHLSIDLRSLAHPPKALRAQGHTGCSKQLRDSLFTDPVVRDRFQDTCRRVQECLDAAAVNEVVVGVNCKLGRHRSVAFVEELGKCRFKGWNVVITHRDVHIRRSTKKHRGQLRQEEARPAADG